MVNREEELKKQLGCIFVITLKDNTKQYLPMTKYVEVICEIYSCPELRELLLSYGVNINNISDIEISYCYDVLVALKQDNLSMVNKFKDELTELLSKNRTKILDLCIKREITDIKDKKTGELIISTMSPEVIQLHEFVHKGDVVIEKRMEEIDTYIVKIIASDRNGNKTTSYLQKHSDNIYLIDNIAYSTRYMKYEDAVRDFKRATNEVYLSDFHYEYAIINIKDSDSYEFI